MPIPRARFLPAQSSTATDLLAIRRTFRPGLKHNPLLRASMIEPPECFQTAHDGYTDLFQDVPVQHSRSCYSPILNAPCISALAAPLRQPEGDGVDQFGQS